MRSVVCDVMCVLAVLCSFFSRWVLASIDRSCVYVCVIVCVTEIGAHKEALEEQAVNAVDNLHHDDPELDRHARSKERKS